MPIATELQRLQEAKQGIKQSAINLGFDIPSSALISSYPQNIQKTPLTLTMSATTDGDSLSIRLKVNPIPTNFWTGWTSAEYGTGNDNVFNVSVNGVYYTCNMTDGQGGINMFDLGGGDFDIEAVFVSSNYYSNYVTTSVTISGVTIDPDALEIEQFDNKVLVKGLPSDATGVARILLEGNSYSGYVENSYALIDLSGTPGESEVEVIYNGDDKYASAITESTVILPKYDCYLSISSYDSRIGERTVIAVNTPEYATGVIRFFVTGKDGGVYTSQIIGGQARLETNVWTVSGTVSVVAIYDGDDFYNSATDTAQFIVS